MIRQNWIDWSKSIGIYLVVLGHCSFFNKDIEGFIYTFHMPLFFMISGYLYKDELIPFTSLFTKLKKTVAYTILFYQYYCCNMGTNKIHNKRK